MAIHKIIIHCAATPNGKRLGAAGASQAQVIDRWHGQRGFRRRDTNAAQHNPHLKHIGYHFVIGVTGTVETGRAIGEQGAHVKGHNRNSIGVCMIGTDKYTKAQWQSLYDLIKSLSKQYPDATLKGHRDYSPDLDGDGTIEPHEYTKICPGFDVAEWADNDFEPWPENVCIIKK